MFPSQRDEPGVTGRNLPGLFVFGTGSVVWDDEGLPRKLVPGLTIVYQAEANPAAAIVLFNLKRYFF